MLLYQFLGNRKHVLTMIDMFALVLIPLLIIFIDVPGKIGYYLDCKKTIQKRAVQRTLPTHWR